MVVIVATYAISTYHHTSCEFESCSQLYSIQHYVIKLDNDLRQDRWYVSLWAPSYFCFVCAAFTMYTLYQNARLLHTWKCIDIIPLSCERFLSIFRLIFYVILWIWHFSTYNMQTCIYMLEQWLVWIWIKSRSYEVLPFLAQL